jgi:hypothetical protein
LTWLTQAEQPADQQVFAQTPLIAAKLVLNHFPDSRDSAEQKTLFGTSPIL